MNTQTNIAILLRPEKNTVTYFSYTVTYFLFYGVFKKKPKRLFFGAYTEPSKMILLPKWAPKNALFCFFFGHPIKRKICYSTPPTWGHTIEASFPHIFIFSGLSNGHIQQ